MNIVRENREGQTALLKVTVAESDYAETVEKTLRDYRRKANIPGFRKGMVPMGIINKMYRKGVLAEEAYRTASKACFDYIEQEKIDYVGDVLPASEQGELDFDNNTEFEFVFEIGFAPQVDIELGAKDKVTRYTIKVDEEMLSGYRSNFLRRYGQLVDVDEVTNDEAVTGVLDNGDMQVEDAYIGLISMSEEDRKPFIGKKAGDKMQVNLNEIYKNPSQRAAMLQMKEEELEGINPEFELSITKIRKFAEPELNEEFFKTAFPDGSITTAEAFEEFLRGQIASDLSRDTDYMLQFEVRKLLMSKADLAMPEDFLKRWLFAINEGKFTMEEIEKDFDKFVEMMRWNIIQKHFADKLQLEITPEEALEEAKSLTRMQFAQYGMSNVEDEMLSGYAQQLLQNKEEGRKIYDRLYERKVIDGVLPMLKIAEKEVTMEEFGKIAEKVSK